MAEQQHPPDEGRGPVEQPAAVFPPGHPTPNPEVGHEHGDVNVKAILYFAGGLVLLALVIHFGVGWMYSAFERSEARAKRSQFPLAEEKKRQRGGEDPEPAEPQLEGIKYRRGERAGVSTEDELTRFGWVDEKKDLVSVPVEDAFERLLAGKKLKVRQGGGREWRDRGLTVPSDANSGRWPREK